MTQFRQSQGDIDRWWGHVLAGRQANGEGVTPGDVGQNTAMRAAARRQLRADVGASDPITDFTDSYRKLLEAKAELSSGQMKRAGESLADRAIGAAESGYMTAVEKYGAKTEAMEAVGKGLDPEAQRRRSKAFTRDLMAGLGIDRPLDTFKDSLGELQAARDKGLVSPEEYARRRRQLRREAIGKETAQIEEVSPIAAMQVGSAAAYSMIVQSQLNDPKIALAKATVDKLDAIEKNTRPAAGGGPDVFDGQK